METKNRSLAGNSPALVPIREIGPRYREQFLRHLLALDEHDRYLRFGYTATDRQIAKYVEGVDFERDQVFGIFNRRLELIAVAHLANPEDFQRCGYSEFGVSVSKHARGRGYGSRLFERAAIHAVNDGVRMLYVHALSENAPMIRIARKAGATVEREGSESECYLKLPVASLETRLNELVSGQFGQIDYWLKSEFSQMRDLLGFMQQVRSGVQDARHKAGS
ncbi:GNAT family N-acetyltransferase [Ottowia caeni]|uniref:GNAT family N-acetyltransferase n=1 Tax=Ottowia caeni TaxID=2870339 RepID=UPI001E5FA4E6